MSLKFTRVKVVLMQSQSKGNEMKINIQILYSALRDPVKFNKNMVAKSRTIISQSLVKIYRLLWQRMDFYSVLQKNYTH